MYPPQKRQMRANAPSRPRVRIAYIANAIAIAVVLTRIGNVRADVANVGNAVSVLVVLDRAVDTIA